jgi:AhpD family alkylhydroperoxidase
MPDALQALLAFGKTAENGVPVTTIQLVQLRASQINGCSVCVAMHYQYLKDAATRPTSPMRNARTLRVPSGKMRARTPRATGRCPGTRRTP